MKDNNKGKILIKYHGDLKYSVNIKGDLPLMSILTQMMFECAEANGVEKEQLFSGLEDCYDAFKKGRK